MQKNASSPFKKYLDALLVHPLKITPTRVQKNASPQYQPTTITVPHFVLPPSLYQQKKQLTKSLQLAACYTFT